jgi:hypothetical protein
MEIPEAQSNNPGCYLAADKVDLILMDVELAKKSFAELIGRVLDTPA